MYVSQLSWLRVGFEASSNSAKNSAKLFLLPLHPFTEDCLQGGATHWYCASHGVSLHQNHPMLKERIATSWIEAPTLVVRVLTEFAGCISKEPLRKKVPSSYEDGWDAHIHLCCGKQARRMKGAWNGREGGWVWRGRHSPVGWSEDLRLLGPLCGCTAEWPMATASLLWAYASAMRWVISSSRSMVLPMQNALLGALW